MTTVHDAGVPQSDIDGVQVAVRKGLMPIRVYAMVRGPSGPTLDAWLAPGRRSAIPDGAQHQAGVGGALGSRGAAMLEPYSDDPGNRGLPILDRALIRSVAEKAVRKGFQVNTHAIGDAANRAALDAYGDVLKGPNDRRFRVEHAQVVAPEDFEKFRKYSVIASMQPTHATSECRGRGSRRAGAHQRRVCVADADETGRACAQRVGFSGGESESALGILRGRHAPGS